MENSIKKDPYILPDGRPITPDLLELFPEDEKNNEFIAVASLSFFQDVWRKFKRNKLAVLGLFCITIILLFAIFGPALSPYTYDGIDLGLSLIHIWFRNFWH